MRQERMISYLWMFMAHVTRRGRGSMSSGEMSRFPSSCYAFLTLMVVTGYAGDPSPEGTQAEEQSVAEARTVVARVNSEPIYEAQLTPEVERGLRTFRRHGMRKEDPDLVKRLRGRTLDKLIGEELIRQESQKLTIENIDEKVAQKLKALERKYGSGKGKGIEKYLKRRSLTMEDLRESFRARVAVDEYLKKQGILEPEIPENRIREVYAGNPDGYSREETIKVSHVLIAVDAHAGAEEKEQTRQKAEQIREKILGGKDFAKMAKEHSDCNSASGGGDLRYIKKGYMPKEFDNVAFAIEKDGVSEVVETSFGYHIIKVFEKKPSGVVPYEEVRDFIKKFLQEEESKKKLASHIVELKRESKIEILLK